MKLQNCYASLTLQVLDIIFRHHKSGKPVRMLTSFHDILLGSLVGAPFTCDAGEIYFMLFMLSIRHDHMNQVLIHGGIQTL